MLAVIGMACRFPGSPDVESYWDLLRSGRRGIRVTAEGELAGIRSPAFVPAFGAVDGGYRFDHEFFGYSRGEASTTDPQQRWLLECAWTALEHAGYAGPDRPHRVGVFAGAGANTYLLNHLLGTRSGGNGYDLAELAIGNEKDFLASRLSYKLDLAGPSVAVQSACSTSLVALHYAGQSLLAGECDLALAGGAALTFPPPLGYRHRTGGILSPDGHCRAFDAAAGGTVPGNGVGIVVLKRLADAIADRDTVYAVLLGSAVNNDGAAKMGYTAPSVDMQAAVIAAAHTAADISPDRVGYVEAHGTGTKLGDPVEVRALARAFGGPRPAGERCALGSVKTNIGHLDAAAGIAGFIKSVLCVHHSMMVPSLDFDRPNPLIEFDRTPFFVNTQNSPWPGKPWPRVAGVSSFGIGGTNAHVVIEQGPVLGGAEHEDRAYPICLSARTPAALERSVQATAAALCHDPDAPIRDAAHTLQVGRKTFPYRVAVAAARGDEAAGLLRVEAKQVTNPASLDGDEVVFGFPGQGSQYRAMGASLHAADEGFRADVEECLALLREQSNVDIRSLLTGEQGDDRSIDATDLAQPALFVVEYSLARLLMRWGIRPAAIIGHSIGELVGACVAGVFTLSDALDVVAHRGQLMAAAPAGGMLAVACDGSMLRDRIPATLDLAVVNGPRSCVVAGPPAELERFGATLSAAGISTQRLRVSGAFHSRAMDAAADHLVCHLTELDLRVPRIPFVSNVTGGLIAPDRASDPGYWGTQLRGTVRFDDGLTSLRQAGYRVLVEVGPGVRLTRMAIENDRAWQAVATLGKGDDETRCLAAATARLFALGADLDAEAIWAGRRARRIGLPGYSFEPTRCVVDDESAASLDDVAPPAAAEPGRAEHNELEDICTEVFRDVLGTTRMGADDDFFELGGHSLAAVRLAENLTTRVGGVVTPDMVFHAPTPRAMTKLLAQPSSARQPATHTGLDRAMSFALDPSIVCGTPTKWPVRPDTVLLTGATGYLGAHLLRELLDSTAASVRCLVRAESVSGAFARIRDALAGYGLWHEGLAGRIVAIPGDLGQPRLGLPVQAFAALARDVEAVYHAGAAVNFARPYPQLEAVNVRGTEEIIRLCAQAAIPLHHISTAAVVASRPGTGSRVGEDEPLRGAEDLHTGYAVSKWVAERLVAQAAERGVGTIVYRPPSVAGSTKTGSSNPNDLAVRMLRGCVELGLAPDTASASYVVPIDFVVQAIRHISLSPDEIGRTFHLIEHEPISLRALFERVRTLGFDVALVPYDEWRRRAIAHVADEPAHPLRPLMAVLGERFFSDTPRLSNHNTREALAGSGIACPVLDNDLLRFYLDRMVAETDTGEL